ncbi:PTS transporter subunit IIC [Streptococcus merionis]|uniref:PTS transporter subunit IIC n=1 Tax=Streptococcus merionis TaxID=400065 RepID=UPI0035137DF7
MTKTKKGTVSTFINNVLGGTAIAIVVALIPNAILATFLKPLLPNVFAAEFLHIVQVFQFFTPIMAGILIAQKFELNPMQQLAVGGAAYIGSGAWVFTEITQEGVATGIFQLKGIGDLINMMITAALAVLAVQLFGDKFGSLNIICLPIIIGTGVGYIGWKILPYVSYVTTLIGQGINSFTVLQPVLMSILIAISFAILIVSPISTVAIGLAIGLNGLSAGAASMGVAATTAVLVWGTLKKNKAGVPLAIALGAMKMMMPNFLKHPQIAVPMIINAAVSVLTVPMFNLIGTPATSGFGLVGLVGPIASLAGGCGVVMMLVAWIVVPFATGYLAHRLCRDVFKLYTDDTFIFEG